MTGKKRRNPGEVERARQIETRLRADQQGRRVRWDHLLQVRNDYVSWTEFSFWARSIIEAEGKIPDWLNKIFREKCPGFLEYEETYRKKHPRHNSLLWKRLSEWVDGRIFAFAQQEGWFSAITFYAARDPRFHRAEAYWRECHAQWKLRRPSLYPRLEEWRLAAGQCDDTPLLCHEIRTIMESLKGVPAERLSAALDRYIDWEAFAYWSRSAIDAEGELPPEVQHELQARCPGFLEWEWQMRRKDPPGQPQSFTRLLKWGEDQFFAEAKSDGWFDAVLWHASNHPRNVRTAEYWVHWDSQWEPNRKASYPSFREWRKAADAYVEEYSD